MNPLSKQGAPHRRLVRSALGGVLGGLAVAAVCIGIGMLRAAVLALAGEELAPFTVDEAWSLAGYALAFGAGGMVVGWSWPWIRHRVVRHLAFYLAGMVFVAALLAADGQSAREYGIIGWFMIAVLGVILGLFGVYFLERDYPHLVGLQSRKGNGRAGSRAI